MPAAAKHYKQQRRSKGYAEPVKPTALIAKKSSVKVHDLTEIKIARHASTLIATSGRDHAIRDARAKVERISRDCRRHNVKYRDPHFDLSERPNYCLYGLPASMEEADGVAKPAEARRVTEIFDNPKFIVDGIDAGDIKQGAAGDCWFLAAVATIANMPGLLESICVARDEEVGVYGFIFFRDGEWVSEVVDDQLFIKAGEFALAPEDMRNAFDDEDQYRAALQKGSKALHFAHCADSNETWLPLLEKAFAKIHGDYSAIEAGLTGEGVEDLTGGVTSEIISRDILDKNRFWNEELLKVNKEFLFAGAIFREGVERVKGILTGHAYSVLQAVETHGLRLVKVRNPWGQTEWTGAWSDGSPEWTAEWMTTLNHRFGDDGAFWMSYDDFLHTFTLVDRTRVFTSEWRVAQCWTQQVVTWPTHTFHTTEFVLSLNEAGPVVIVLQQADARYFKGLEGQYRFTLHFRVRRDGETEYYSRSKQAIIMSRSINTELQLDAGQWRVSYKITRQCVGRKSRSEYIDTFSAQQSDKFVAVARNFDYSLALNQLYTGDNDEEDKKEEQEWEDEEDVQHVEVVEEEQEAQEEPEDEDEVGEQQNEEEEESVAQAEPEAPEVDELDHIEYLDSILMVGIRVHAKDPALRVRIEHDVESAAEWDVDPDDSFVQSFHTRTGQEGAIISKLAK